MIYSPKSNYDYIIYLLLLYHLKQFNSYYCGPSVVVSQDPGPTIATEDVSIETISSHPQELLDIVQESITGVGGATTPTATDEHAPES